MTLDSDNIKIQHLEEENRRLRTLLAEKENNRESLSPPENLLAEQTRELTNTREELGQQVRLFDTVLSSIVDFAYILDREGRFTYVNQALLALWQMKLEDALGKNFFDLGYPAELAARLQRQVETVFRTGQTLKDETLYTGAAGTTGCYEYIFSPVFDKDGAVEIIVGSTRDISERSSIEEELRDARARLQATLNAGVVATWTWNLQTNTVIADKNLARLLSVSPEDAAGGPITAYLNAIHPDDVARVEQAIQTAFESGKYEVECRVILPDGSIRQVIARGKVEYDAQGTPLNMPGVVVDITERKEAEDTLLLFRTVLENTDDCVGMATLDGVPFYINPAARRLIGLDNLEKTNQIPLKDFFFPEDQPFIIDEFLPRVIREGHAEVEIRFRNFKTGAPCWMIYSLFTLTNTQGEPVGIATVSRDIDARKRMEEALAESEQKFRLVTDMMPQLVWSTLPDGFHDYYNARWFEYTGLTFEDTQGEKWNDVLHPDDQARAWKVWKRSLETGEPYVIEYRFKRYDGTYHWFIARALPLYDAEGRIIRWFGTCTDLDDQKRTVDALRRQRQEIEALNARLKRSMTETHHRVKNNLQMISSLIDMQRASGAATVPMIELIRLSANVIALGVIHDILTQEASAGNDQETLSIRAVLEKLMEVLKQTIGDRTLTTSFDDIRLSGGQVTTLALVTNELVANALKHGRGRIEVCFRLDGDTATLEVCDDGSGFIDGFDAATAGSTGLELVENIVRWDLRGRIAYTNRPGGGAQICVAFPHTPEEDAD